MIFRRRRRQTIFVWELKATTPEGTILEIDTESLYFTWKYGGTRTNDGYIDLLEMPRLHLWVKPKGWTEPDRAAALDGTAAVRQDLRWS
jgi:hypothetical protein